MLILLHKELYACGFPYFSNFAQCFYVM